MKLIAKLNDLNVLGRDGMSTKAPRLAVRGIIRNSEGLYAVMFLRKFGLYSLPGGGVEAGERYEDALKREMAEEVGFICGEVCEIGAVDENRACGNFTQINHYYSADAIEECGQHMTKKEIDNETELQWHTFEDIYKLISEENDIGNDQRKYVRARDLAALDEYRKKTDKDMSTWKMLYNKAKEVRNDRVVSPFIEAGGVAASILTRKGNVYVGVCIDTCCGLGMCAERNAIASMLTHGEHEIEKIVAVMSDGKVGSPCGACREMLMQLSQDSGEIEILVDYETQKTVKLGELVPDWWGKERFKNNKGE